MFSLVTCRMDNKRNQLNLKKTEDRPRSFKRLEQTVITVAGIELWQVLPWWWLASKHSHSTIWNGEGRGRSGTYATQHDKTSSTAEGTRWQQSGYATHTQHTSHGLCKSLEWILLDKNAEWVRQLRMMYPNFQTDDNLHITPWVPTDKNLHTRRWTITHFDVQLDNSTLSLLSGCLQKWFFLKVKVWNWTLKNI